MELPDFLALIQTGGPAAVIFLLGFLLWEERKEHKETRKALDAQGDDATKDAIAMTREVVSAVQNATSVIAKMGDGQREMRDFMAKIAEGITILSDRRGRRG